LKRLYQQGDSSKVPPDRAARIADVLGHMDMARHPSDVDLPGYRLHPLKGEWKGMWSVAISGNLRIVYAFRMATHSILTWSTTTREELQYAYEKSAASRPLN
jgi:toxin HigB-1